MPAANFLPYADLRQNALNLIQGEYEDKLNKLKEANKKNEEIQKKTVISINDLSAQAQLQIRELTRAITNLDKSSKSDEEKSIILGGLMEDMFGRVDRGYNTGVWWVLGKLTSRVDAKNSYFYNNLRPAMGEVITPKPTPAVANKKEKSEAVQELEKEFDQSEQDQQEDVVFSQDNKLRMLFMYHMFNAQEQLRIIYDTKKFQEYVRNNIYDKTLAKMLLDTQIEYLAIHEKNIKSAKVSVVKVINDKVKQAESGLKSEKYPDDVNHNHNATGHLRHVETKVKLGQIADKSIQPKEFKDIKVIQDNQEIFKQQIKPQLLGLFNEGELKAKLKDTNAAHPAQKTKEQLQKSQEAYNERVQMRPRR